MAEDPMRPTSQRFRDTYDTAFQAWAKLYLYAISNPSLPVAYLSAKVAFRRHPYFPPFLRLKTVQAARYSGPPRLYAVGSSTWGSPPCTDDAEFAVFRKQVEIEVAMNSPITLSISEPAQQDLCIHPWFVQADTCYVPILILAWAYILAARWTELLGEGCSLSYADSRAAYQNGASKPPPGQNTSHVDVGAASTEETRWWAAVLAPGQGWRSVATSGQHISPWSVSLQSSLSFVVRTNGPYSESASHSAPSSSTAVRFLDRFCLRHDIMDQSHAALAAVLLFPCFGKNKTLQLPHPGPYNEARPKETAHYQPSFLSENQPFHDWVHEGHHLDRLLALSCNIRGIRPMLLSVFYEPRVDCNLVNAWLQGTAAAIDSTARDDPHILGRMLMEREPSVAFLWVGATILQLQGTILQEMRRGQIPSDLHSAVWSGTTQSFLQQPVSDPLAANGCVSRADECRLLFLSQSGQRARTPVCQWRPFGATPVGDADLEVRVHENCANHWLRYRGFSWDCVDGESHFQPSDHAIEGRPAIDRDRAAVERLDGGLEIPILRDGLDSDKEFVSENATRSILGWLRSDGWARHEKDMRAHEWFDVFDSDEEEEEGGGGDGYEDVSAAAAAAAAKDRDITPIRDWLFGLDEATGNSERNGTSG